MATTIITQLKDAEQQAPDRGAKILRQMIGPDNPNCSKMRTPGRGRPQMGSFWQRTMSWRNWSRCLGRVRSPVPAFILQGDDQPRGRPLLPAMDKVPGLATGRMALLLAAIAVVERIGKAGRDQGSVRRRAVRVPQAGVGLRTFVKATGRQPVTLKIGQKIADAK
jgi:hypothetical protein